MLDRIDKAILRVLIAYRNQHLTTNQIAIKSKISPLTAKRHLKKLMRAGYVSSKTAGKIRRYDLK